MRPVVNSACPATIEPASMGKTTSFLSAAGYSTNQAVSHARKSFDNTANLCDNATAFVGFLLPLRQTGTLLTQLFVSGQMPRYLQPKWFRMVAADIRSMVGAAVGRLLPEASVEAGKSPEKNDDRRKC